MPQTTINVSIDDSQVRVMIQAYQKLFPSKVRDFLKNDVTQLMRESFASNFDSEGRPNRWKALADSTVKKRGSSNPILDVTGDLRSEVTSESHKSHLEEVSQNTDGFTLTMGAKSPKYKTHQKGGFGSFGQFIPKRRMIVIQEEDGEKIGVKLDELVKTFRRS